MATTENTVDISNESQNQNSEGTGASVNRAARLGLWALGLGFGSFVLWASLAPLDEGVPAQGMVAIDTKRKAVQHLSGGLIKQVLVKEGDHVKEGQVLMRLDEAVARSNFESSRQRYVGLRAMEGRLLSEQKGFNRINFHDDVKEAGQDPQIQQIIVAQEQLFQSRRGSLQAELQGYQEAVEGQQALIQAYETMLVNRKNQQALIAEELSNTRDLVREGYAPRNRQLELERSAAEISSGIAELQGNIVRARKSVAETQQRSAMRQQEYRKEVESQLTDVGREVRAEAEKYTAAKGDLSRIEIKSPATGQVVALAMQTVGGVVGAGQKLMDVVPEGQLLMIEVRVPPHQIDRVHAGMPVDVRFSAFAHTPQLVVEGKLESVSADVVSEPQTNQTYFLARVAVTDQGFQKLGDRKLQPGMPVEVVFLTGERSMLKYLLNPLLKRMAASMKEE